MEEIRDLMYRAADVAAAYRAAVPDLPVRAEHDLAGARQAFALPLPDDPVPAAQVLDELVAAAGPGLVGTAGPRYFGFVVGGSLPVATAADILTTGWDQVGFGQATSPAAVGAEAVAGDWLKSLLGIPAHASVGFVTGAQAANTVGLAAARHHVLSAVGWDVERRGLAGAPPVRVVAGAERHATVDRALRLLGFGADVVEAVPADEQGAIDVAALRQVLARQEPGPTIVCLQAGNVNTGACDNLLEACESVRAHGGWVHVDGAFGLWAGADPATRHLVEGVELADSWGCDGHKWLNVPYDSGYAFCAHPDAHAAALSYTAAYLTGTGVGTPVGGDLVPESSRRARGFATWACLRHLGRSGVADLVGRCCALARRFADGLTAEGFEVPHEVVLNQVLVDFGDAARTDRVVEAVQRDGTCWMGATTWRGRRLMRIAVSNHTTTERDVDRSVEAIARLAATV
jgi:glutamate/tyrosine decarboxylase-like PLP-dependent enzyme